MKNLKLIQNLSIICLLLVFSGCAEVNMTPTDQFTSIPNPDATITFVNGKLDHVTRVAEKRRGGLFIWHIVPPGFKVRVCIKKGSINPFIGKEWATGCNEGNDRIEGKIDSGLNIPPGSEFLVVKYTVYDLKNRTSIDPEIKGY